MKLALTTCVAFVLLPAVLGTDSARRDTLWTDLDKPGASEVCANGIYENNVVGYYHEQVKNWPRHAFLYDGKTWTSFDKPGAAHTRTFGIYRNKIVGNYDDAARRQHGFLYDGKSWTTLDKPGAVEICACGVYENKIVGYYYDPHADQNHHDNFIRHLDGFLYDGTNWTTVAKPGASSTWAYGIYEDKIVGSYQDTDGKYHGFLYDGKAWTTLDKPGAIGTEAHGIYGNNIVGYYYVTDADARGRNSHGFLYDGKDWSIIDKPEAHGSCAQGIYDNKVVVDCWGVSFVCMIPKPTVP